MSGFPHSTKRWALLLALSGLAVAACTKEYVSPIPFERGQLLTAPGARWFIRGRVSSYNGTPYDLYATGDACHKDNYRSFLPDSVLDWRNGPLHCTALDSDSVAGRWRLSADYLTLSLTDDPDLGQPSYQIRRLDSDTMVLRWSETSVNGALLTETVTLTTR